MVIQINNGNLSKHEQEFLSKQYDANEINLKIGIEEILGRYKKFRKIIRKEEMRRKDIDGFDPVYVQFDDQNKENLTNLIYRGLSKNCIRQIINETHLENNFSSKGSVRQPNIPISPFLAIKENNNGIPEINIKMGTDFYIAYLFRTDLSGVYLTLVWGSDEVKDFKNNNDSFFIKRSQKSIIEKYEYITSSKIDLNKFNTIHIDLKCYPPYNCTYEKKYEDGVIFSKFYSRDNIPSNEMLVNDLKDYLKLYDFCLNYDIIPKTRYSMEDAINMVYDFLKEIFDKYEVEKNNSFKDNYFIKEINDKFYDSFDKFISQFVDPKYQDKFNTEIDFGKDDWNAYPIIKIYYDKLSTNKSKGLYIYSLLNTSSRELEFGFILDDNNFNNISNEQFLNYLFNCVEDDETQLDETESKIILKKNIQLEVLEDRLLEVEFEEIIKKFEDLINNYVNYVFEREIKGRTIVHDAPSLSINFNDLKNELPQTFEINDNKIKEVCAAFNSSNIILKGVPGTGKTFIAETLASLGSKNDFVDGYLLTTATSDWSTFDTMGGLMPTDDEKLVFRPGKFLEAIELNKWLIIDEINRADIDKAFGQLFTVLSGYDVELPYKDSEGNSIKIVKDEYSNKSYRDPISGNYVIGKNWRIIGTMNTVDKDTLYDLSFAFMRRFMFIDIDVPNYDEKFKEEWINRYFKEILEKPYHDKIIKVWEISSSREFGPAIYGDLLRYINERVEMDNLKIFKSDNIGTEIDGEMDDNSEDPNLQNFYSIMASGINAYIVPQLEGLSDKKDIDEVKENIEEYFKAYYNIYDKEKIGKILDDLLNGPLV